MSIEIWYNMKLQHFASCSIQTSNTVDYEIVDTFWIFANFLFLNHFTIIRSILLLCVNIQSSICLSNIGFNVYKQNKINLLVCLEYIYRLIYWWSGGSLKLYNSTHENVYICSSNTGFCCQADVDSVVQNLRKKIILNMLWKINRFLSGDRKLVKYMSIHTQRL